MKRHWAVSQTAAYNIRDISSLSSQLGNTTSLARYDTQEAAEEAAEKLARGGQTCILYEAIKQYQPAAQIDVLELEA